VPRFIRQLGRQQHLGNQCAVLAHAVHRRVEHRDAYDLLGLGRRGGGVVTGQRPRPAAAHPQLARGMISRSHEVTVLIVSAANA
jgi:hypothetical protein